MCRANRLRFLYLQKDKALALEVYLQKLLLQEKVFLHNEMTNL